MEYSHLYKCIVPSVGDWKKMNSEQNDSVRLRPRDHNVSWASASSVSEIQLTSSYDNLLLCVRTKEELGRKRLWSVRSCMFM